MPSSNTIQFIQSVQPALKDGEYTISVEQTLTIDGASTFVYQDVKNFAVAGERFSLDPSDVVSVFPSAFSLGEFSNVLPHIVFKRNTLPWERSPGNNASQPWVGLLLFHEDDPVSNNGQVSQVQLLDLLSKTQVSNDGQPGRLPNNTYFPIFPLNSSGQATLDYGESWTDPCTVIDISRDLFTKIAPSLDDLQWLAHVRQDNSGLGDRSETYIKNLYTNTVTQDDTSVQYSVVIGNRFAQRSKKSTVYLVSFENFGDVLPQNDGSINPQFPPDDTMVRLVVLYQWTYSCITEENTFTGLLTHLNSQNTNISTLQIPFTNSGGAGDTDVANALSMGFAAFNHSTRMGDTLVSWYHGPFAPFDISTIDSNFDTTAADQLTQYNPKTGMFDISYSAAWQLGKLLALQNKSFATALYNWKRSHQLYCIAEVKKKLFPPKTSNISEVLSEALAKYAEIHTDSDEAATADNRTPSRLPLQQNITKQQQFYAITEAMQDINLIQQILDPDDRLNIPPAPMPPDIVYNFLGRLMLLYGVPFNYLVPDERMLPQESLRFFYLDTDWIIAFLEGAFSIGSTSNTFFAMDQVLKKIVRKNTNSRLSHIRNTITNRQGKISATLSADNTLDNTVNINTCSGFLLRSQAVTGWPGLKIQAFDADNNPLTILRFEELSADVMVCIFSGIVKTLSVQVHPEALHFGVDENASTDPLSFTKSLRYTVAKDSAQPGSQIPNEALPLRSYYRDPDVLPPAQPSLVLKIDALANSIRSKLETIYSPPPPVQFTSAEFALEMIEGMPKVTFTIS